MTVGSTRAQLQREALPDFLEFNFDPKEGYQIHGLNFWTYCRWGGKDDMLKTFAFPTFLYMTATASLGGAIGFIHSALTKDKFSLSQATEDALKWVVPSAIAGLGLGYYRYETYSLKNHVVMNLADNSSEKAKTILEAFLESHLNSHQDREEFKDIFCPISLQVMAYPVKTNCDAKGHTFEYYSVLKLFENKSHAPCPLCRKQIKLEDLTHNQELELKIGNIVKTFFLKLEILLQSLPRDLDDILIPDFSDSSMTSYLYDKAQQGQEFLEGDAISIVQKIHQPDQLSKEELFALSYFFINQIFPLKEKIDSIHNIAGKFLMQLRTKGSINQSVFNSQMVKLSNWYTHFEVIPEECKIINKFYIMAKEKKDSR
ncbi:NSE2 family E3 SUMO-protein ligase [Rhabdochlamydiaceae symbiont of Dictyostelium giganteum]|uniref:NSE2 family E3 SUMO-protein ligase n=1 Tax=Rhabdochlamydiaceae symbiont of Dictyostelium giganteum TaxID=3342349 RepID=UPI00384C6161